MDSAYEAMHAFFRLGAMPIALVLEGGLHVTSIVPLDATSRQSMFHPDDASRMVFIVRAAVSARQYIEEHV